MNKKLSILITLLLTLSIIQGRLSFSLVGEYYEADPWFHESSLQQINGKWVSVSAGQDRAYLFDLSDPTNPTKIHQFPGITSCRSLIAIESSGKFYAYLPNYVSADKSQEIHIFDITDINNVQFVNKFSYDATNDGSTVSFHEYTNKNGIRSLVLVTYKSYIYFYNIEDPENPTQISVDRQMTENNRNKNDLFQAASGEYWIAFPCIDFAYFIQVSDPNNVGVPVGISTPLGQTHRVNHHMMLDGKGYVFIDEDGVNIFEDTKLGQSNPTNLYTAYKETSALYGVEMLTYDGVDYILIGNNNSRWVIEATDIATGTMPSQDQVIQGGLDTIYDVDYFFDQNNKINLMFTLWRGHAIKIYQLRDPLTCQAGHFGNKKATCEACASQCSSCQFAATNCTACNGSGRDVANNCLCASTHYDDSGVCTQCLDKCATCSNGTSCDTCKGSIRQLSDNCDCPSNYYEDVNKDCQLCTGKCVTCSDADTCLTCQGSIRQPGDKCECPQGYTENSDGDCIADCAAGTFVNSLGQCQACQYPCASCEGQADNCLSCQQPEQRDSDCKCKPNTGDNGQGCVEGQRGYFSVVQPDGTLSFEKCNEGCGDCNDLNSCSTCEDGSDVKEDGSCEVKKQGQLCDPKKREFEREGKCYPCYMYKGTCVESCNKFYRYQNEQTRNCDDIDGWNVEDYVLMTLIGILIFLIIVTAVTSKIKPNCFMMFILGKKNKEQEKLHDKNSSEGNENQQDEISEQQQQIEVENSCNNLKQEQIVASELSGQEDQNVIQDIEVHEF